MLPKKISLVFSKRLRGMVEPDPTSPDADYWPSDIKLVMDFYAKAIQAFTLRSPSPFFKEHNRVSSIWAEALKCAHQSSRIVAFAEKHDSGFVYLSFRFYMPQGKSPQQMVSVCFPDTVEGIWDGCGGQPT